MASFTSATSNIQYICNDIFKKNFYFITGLESTKRLRKIEDDLMNHPTAITRSSELVGVSSRNTCSNKSNNTMDPTVSNHSNVSTPTPVSVPYKNQLVILCSANSDAATAKLAFDAGIAFKN